MKKTLVKLLKNTVRLAIFVGLAVGAWYAYNYYMPAEEEDGLGALPSAIAEVRDITVSVQATGVLQPIKIVEIKSKASGEILNMPVEVGDHVEAGDLIAQVDTDILDQELKQVQADYESAVTRLDIAKSQYERAQSLFEQDLMSENDLETSQQNYTSAEAQMLRSEAALELAKERLADATVRAPSRGTIIAKSVEEGQIIASSTNNVSGGTTLVQMADLSRLQIRTLVDEVDIGQVRPGLQVESTVESFPDARFDGEVMMIEPQAVVQQSVTTFPVLSRIDNEDGRLLPGMNAKVSIVVHRKPGVLAVPNEAVRSLQDAAEVRRMLGLVTDTGEGTSGGRDAGARGRDTAGGSRSRGNSGGPGATSAEGGRRGADDGASGGSTAAGGEGRDGGFGRSASGATGSQGGGSAGQGSRGRGAGAQGGARSGATSGGDRSGATSGGDARARFENATPEERARMMAAMRARAESADRDPFGIGGRRETAVVFLYDAAGQLTTRDVVVGARDWEYTEVLDGLVAGDQILILPSNSLLRSQDRLRSWAQGRSGIPGMGGGGPPPGMGRGRGRGF